MSKRDSKGDDVLSLGGNRVDFSFIDREPLWRKLSNRVEEAASETRNIATDATKKRVPKLEHRNFGDGKFTGIIGAGIATILEDTVGVPFGASTEVVDVEPGREEGSTIYTVNVNAPTVNIAESRAFLDASTGFTSFLMDEYDIESAEIINHRPLRDTHQIEVKVVK